MNKLLPICSLLSATVLLSGCSALTSLFSQLGSSTTSSSLSADINGDGETSAGERALSAYNATHAQDGSPGSVLDAQKRQEGISGFGVGNDRLVSTATDGSGFKTANVKVSADNKQLEITVDGKKYSISGDGTKYTHQVGGKDYISYAFGYGELANSPNSGVDVGSILNGQYASLAFIYENAQDLDHNGIVTAGEGFVMVSTGLETPEAGMPSQKISYGGDYYLAFTNSGQSAGYGSFEAIADFGAKTITADTTYEGTKNGGFEGVITGNKFSGAVNSTWENGYKGDVVGAFYGPNAEEIAGASVGTMGSQDATAFFIGNKQ